MYLGWLPFSFWMGVKASSVTWMVDGGEVGGDVIVFILVKAPVDMSCVYSWWRPLGDYILM